MTVHYELPTTTDFAALAGPHHPAITIMTLTGSSGERQHNTQQNRNGVWFGHRDQFNFARRV